MIYRRSPHQAAWHFCRNCPQWPEAAFEERSIEPRREALCPECVAIHEASKCEAMPPPGAA
ncbi:MAG TPA: hypothetical protein VFK15_07955 [Burkholderiales bacterium]|jgi:hypothetical protein|nr:hypothetical protein [Burkholderiales bacterium]